MLPKGSRPFDMLGLGEVMLRLSPPDKERLALGDVLEKKAGGSELNVMCGLTQLGLRSGIITKLPDNAMGVFVKNRVRFAGVSDDYLIFDRSPTARLGIYYYEMGAYPRKSSVLYDRGNSSFTTLSMSELPAGIGGQARGFHVSGITLGLGDRSRLLTLDLLHAFKRGGAFISFDVNYRAGLWSEDAARGALRDVLPLVDALFVSEETSRRMMGMTGTPEELARRYREEYGCSLVGLTMRQALSPVRQNWSSLIYDAATDTAYEEAPYVDIEVVDRVGSGDAYVSGVLAGLCLGLPLPEMLEIGNAMAAIKNTIYGDMPGCDLRDVRGVIAAHKGENPSEMNR